MNAVCPSQDQLKSLSLGQLSEAKSDELIVHLQGCETCQNEIGTLGSTEDTFVEKLKLASGERVDEFSGESECRIATTRALAALASVEGDRSNFSSRVPRTIGEYEIVKALGRGGMGQVYLGRHTKLGRAVAIKFIANHGRWDKTMQERFASEMRTIGSLNHPNIVAAHDAREINGLAVLVTEYIEGMDVSEIVKRNGPLSVADSCSIVQSVCKALDYIDSKGLVHRDIKPSNIMIDKTGSVKVLDLGLARVQSENGTGEFTATGQAVGTADYVAPEQIEDGRNLNIRTDIYGLGCTFYKLLCGRAPFAGPEYSTTFAKLNAHVSEVPESLSKFRDDLPAELVELVDRMLKKNPGDRPQTAREVSDQVEMLANPANLSGLVERSQDLSPVQTSFAAAELESVPHKQTQSSFWNKNVWIAAVASALLAMLFGIWLGITITIKKPDGTISKIVIPDGSTAIIDKDGNVDIQLGGGVGELHIPSGQVKVAEPTIGSASASEFDAPKSVGGITITLLKGSPLFGKLETNDVVDLIAAPNEVNSQIAEQNSWPMLVADGVRVINVQVSSEKATFDVKLSKANAENIRSAENAGYKIDPYFHDPKRMLAVDFTKLQGVWQIDTIRDNGIMRADTADITFCFDRNELIIGYGNELERHSFKLSEQPNAGDPESGETRRMTCINEGSKFFGKSAIYRFTDSGKLEVGFLLPSPNSDDDRVLPASIEKADPVLRLQRVSEPKTHNAKKAFKLLHSIHFDEKFEIRIATNIEVNDFGEKQTRHVIEHSLPKHLLEQPADRNAPRPVKPADQVIWLGPAFISNRDLVSASAQKGPDDGWGIRFDLTPQAGQKIAVMTTKYKGEFLAIMIGGKLVSAPKIHETVGENCMLWADWTEEVATTTAKAILPQVRIVNGIKKTALDQSRENLRTLLIGVHNFADAFSHLPASQEIVQGHPVSWRIKLLQFLEHGQDLYNQYRFGEPWDSAHNSKLLAKMPAVYRSPKAPADSQMTSYVGFAGDETAFGIQTGVGLDRFKDGLANTILLVEAETEIPWTKPQDLELTDESLNNLKSFYDGVLPVAMADASTALFSTEVLKASDLKKFLTRAGNDYVDQDEFLIKDGSEK